MRYATLAVFAAGWLLSAKASAQATDDRPNILFVFTDDHAAHAISAYGSRINQTPNIDRLAREGMLFKNCFVTNSICGPSRAVILTGKHSHRNGFLTNEDRFDGTQQTFPKVLQKAGYQTAMIGKWHLKTDPTGFDFWKVLIGQGPYYNPKLSTPAGIEEHTGYTTEIVTDITLDWLEKQRDPSRPFMLMCQHKAPHRDWQPGPKYLNLYDDVTIEEPPTLFDDYKGRASPARGQEMTIASHLTQEDLKLEPPKNLTPAQFAAWNSAYGPKNDAFRRANPSGRDLVRWKYQRYIKDYLRCIAAVDDNIGRLLDYLEKNGLARNTVVIYSSDQGFYLGDHGWYDKRWMYEESLRMPLLVRWPGRVKPGSVSEALVQNLDFASTFLELARAEPPTDLQGKSLVPFLKGTPPNDWRRSVYYHYYEFPAVHMVERHVGVRTDRYKLMHFYGIDQWELYDLEKDPRELTSVYGRAGYAKVQQELTGELKRLQALYGEPDPTAHRPLRRPTAPAKKDTPEPEERGAPVMLFRRDAWTGPVPGGQKLVPAVAKTPFALGMFCAGVGEDAVLAAQGGGQRGFRLDIDGGTPRFSVREGGIVRTVTGPPLTVERGEIHLLGILDHEGFLSLRLNGEEVARGRGAFLTEVPGEGFELGADSWSPVLGSRAPKPFRGRLRDIRLYAKGVPSEDEVNAWLGPAVLKGQGR